VTPNLQRRHYDYVLGPNQDVRLASVASGAVIQEILLTMDDDAPFVLTSRAVRYAYSTLDQSNLAGLKTRWTGPKRDYRQTDFVLESLQMAYYGQNGCFKPIAPSILYPTRSVLMVDLINTGPTAITNLNFFFRGYKLYPAGTVPAATYPSRMQSETFAYPVYVSSLGIAETRLDQIFTVKQDADFVLRGGQGIVGQAGLVEVLVKFKDHQKNPYSNDFVPLDMLFGSAPLNATIPINSGASYNQVAPFGTGPGQMGLFYPEIYLPKNTQLLYDLQRNDPTGAAASFTFNLIGGKVFVP
jgi:hypothetical protein